MSVVLYGNRNQLSWWQSLTLSTLTKADIALMINCIKGKVSIGNHNNIEPQEEIK